MFDNLPHEIQHKVMGLLLYQDIKHMRLACKTLHISVQNYPFWTQQLVNEFGLECATNEEAKAFYRNNRNILSEKKNILATYGLTLEQFKQGLFQPDLLITSLTNKTLTFLAMASSLGATTILQQCLKTHTQLVDSSADKSLGWTALHYAILHNQIDAAMLLIEKGAKVNRTKDLTLEKFIISPLLLAVSLNDPNEDMIRVLIKNFANPNLKSELWMGNEYKTTTPLEYCHLYKKELVSILENNRGNLLLTL